MNESHPDFTREPQGRFEWERLVRRAVIKPPSVKLLGLVMATYANSDGTRVRPGQKRLANVMGTSISTVERGQRALEAIGFIEMTYKGHSAGRGRSGGYASEYRLTIPSDLLERIPMLDPDENHPAPVTGDSTKDPAPVTGDMGCSEDVRANNSTDIPVNPKESPVTSAETPVNLEEIPVTQDGPPDHYHHIKDHYINHQPASVTLGDARASGFQELAESPSIEDERSRQLAGLEKLQAEYEKQQERKAS
ncbi:helix-turn-helix domain-containing protein [Arthrobacter sp. AL12]|uniref:helix-turn-helix domain-containing protein n=1 Tax=Arthrobacter sp. AL12 TaxID=3042241 RepID=UPI00249B20A5|nr:helix-turn-helix domain-containing protein [Arthrobacter sp. AL12]MDI3211694.1 hypothetical protein [Arthrobacter sp. AL12]